MRHQHKRGIARTQTALLPAAVEDYVGARSVVRLIERYVSGLDLARLGFAKSVAAATGRPAYAPDDLLGLYLYGYWNRVRSSRRLEAECKRNLEVMWLMGQLAPDHKTIADFRRVNAAPFEAACGQFVQFLREVKLVGGEAPVVAVDGSKFKACASKKSVVDAEQLAKERKKLERRIAEYLEEMDEVDRVEDGEVQPSEEQIEAALERLRQRDQKLERAQVERAAREQDSERKDQTLRVSLTDPDCVLLKQKGAGTLAGYNVQHAVDAGHKLIVAHEVTTRGNDHTSLEPSASAAQAALEAPSLIAVADCGFMNGAQAEACEAKGISPVVPMSQFANTRNSDLYAKTMFVYDPQNDAYRCPAGQLLKCYKSDRATQTNYYWTSACACCPLKAQCTRSKRRSIARSWFAAAAERAHERARHNPGLMRLRSATVEHPFGNLKAMMPGGFSLRGLPKVKGEMALAVLTYNLKRAANILGIDKLIAKLELSAQFSSA